MLCIKFKYCIFLYFLFSQFKEDSNDVRLKQSIENDTIDNKYGFVRIKDYQEHTGYLINMHSVNNICIKTIIFFICYGMLLMLINKKISRRKLLMRINVW